MKKLNAILCLSAALHCAAPDARANGIISSETPVAPYQFEPFTNTMTMKLASNPRRRFLIKVWELDPSGVRLRHKVVQQQWVTTRTAATYLPGTLNLRFRNLKGGSGIRYAITITSERNRRTDVRFLGPLFVPSGAGMGWYTSIPLDNPYQVPRNLRVQPPTGQVAIEEF